MSNFPGEADRLRSKQLRWDSTTVWIGSKGRAHLMLPKWLADKYGMNQPCRVAIIDLEEGLLLKYMHPMTRRGKSKKNNE